MKKIKYENKIIGQKEPKNIKKNIFFNSKLSSNTNPLLLKKEHKILSSKLNFQEQNYSSNNENIRSKINLNLHPIKKTRSKNEHEINGFSLFLKGDSNFISSKNEVNLITTQYNYGNNQLLIHKFNKGINIENEDKLRNNLNYGQRKRNIILNDLKNKKKITNELKDIKEIRETIYENKNNVNNTNILNNNKKLPELLKIKNSINLINYLKPARTKFITPLLQNKNSNNLIRKKSETILHKIKREKEKEKNIEKNNKEIKDEKDITYGHKIHWKKINLIKEGENSFIYKAFNISNGHIFIVKEYKKVSVKSFYREAKFLKKNRDKNIVEFIDAEVVNTDNNYINYFYIYLNYIGGYTLNEFYSKIGFFTKQLLKKFIEQIIYFIDYMKIKGLFYNNFDFNHIFFDLDGNIKLIDFSKVEKQNVMIKTNFIRHEEDLDFASFKKMILHIIYYEKNNKGNNNENSNDIISFCNLLEVTLINVNNLIEFKSNYFFGEHKDKEETILLKNSSMNPSFDLIKN